MIEINLLPAEFRGKEKKETSAMPELPYKRLFIVLFAVVLVLEGLLGWLVFYRKGELAKLTVERKQIEPAAHRIQAVKTETVRVQTWLLELEQLTTRRILWTRLLNAISEGMTDDVWLTKMSIKREIKAVSQKAAPRRVRPGAKNRDKDPEKEETSAKKQEPGRPVTKYLMVLNGTVSPKVDSTAAVGRFIKSLETSPTVQMYFSKVWLEKIDHVEEDEGNAEQFNFTVTCLFNKEAGADFDGVF